MHSHVTFSVNKINMDGASWKPKHDFENRKTDILGDWMIPVELILWVLSQSNSEKLSQQLNTISVNNNIDNEGKDFYRLQTKFKDEILFIIWRRLID